MFLKICPGDFYRSAQRNDPINLINKPYRSPLNEGTLFICSYRSDPLVWFRAVFGGFQEAIVNVPKVMAETSVFLLAWNPTELLSIGLGHRSHRLRPSQSAGLIQPFPKRELTKGNLGDNILLVTTLSFSESQAWGARPLCLSLLSAPSVAYG